MNDKLEQKTRLKWIDIVKFLGILAIVWGHTLNDGIIRHYLYSFHVPLFFFVIGLFFSSPKISFIHFTIKKAKSLLIPYFLFASISILIFSVFGEIAVSTIESDGLGNSFIEDWLEMLMGQCRSNRPLWFLPCMFLCYLMCFGLSRVAEKKSVCVKRGVSLLVIAISVSLLLVNENIYKISSLFWKLDVAVFMLAFIATAFLMKNIFSKGINTFVKMVLTVLLLSLGGIIAFLNSEINYLSNVYGNVFLFYFGAVCTATGLCFLSVVLSNINFRFIINPLVYVGKKTLPILLMHKFPILFFQVLFPWTKQPMKDNNAVVGFVVAVISIVLCLLVDFVIQKFFAVFLSKKSVQKEAKKQ